MSTDPVDELEARLPNDLWSPRGDYAQRRKTYRRRIRLKRVLHAYRGELITGRPEAPRVPFRPEGYPSGINRTGKSVEWGVTYAAVPRRPGSDRQELHRVQRVTATWGKASS